LGKELEFEWDEAKARINQEKHRVSFLTAAAIFLNERLERIDDREEYGELRWIALGRVENEVYRVVYTWRNENLVRLISAQKASKDEREIYYRETFAERNQGQAGARRRPDQRGCPGGRVAGRGVLALRAGCDAGWKDLRSPAPR
jgi:uncharacterized DUF497 family protein